MKVHLERYLDILKGTPCRWSFDSDIFVHTCEFFMFDSWYSMGAAEIALGV